MISALSLISAIIGYPGNETDSLVSDDGRIANGRGAGSPGLAATFESALAAASGRKEAEIVREALGQYLGKNDPGSVKGAIASLEDRITTLEKKLAGLGRLVI